MIGVEVADVPGFREAVAVVTGLTESTLEPDDVDAIVAAVMFVTRPHVQAEFAADLADDLADGIFVEAADLLDRISHDIRGWLRGR